MDSDAAMDRVCMIERFVEVLQTTLTLTASAGVARAVVLCKLHLGNGLPMHSAPV